MSPKTVRRLLATAFAAIAIAAVPAATVATAAAPAAAASSSQHVIQPNDTWT